MDLLAWYARREAKVEAGERFHGRKAGDTGEHVAGSRRGSPRQGPGPPGPVTRCTSISSGRFASSTTKSPTGFAARPGSRSCWKHSDGGAIETAVRIYNSLIAHDRYVETRIVGKAMNAAAVLSLGADRRLIAQDGAMLFHEAHRPRRADCGQFYRTSKCGGRLRMQ